MFEMIFSCRCGKQLFGDQIEAEYLRQQAAFDANAQARKAELAATSPAPSQPQRTAPIAPSPVTSKIVSNTEWVEPTAVTGPSSATNDGDHSICDRSNCEWHSCNNPPRPNSKYCSRDCSNKNARLRYKKRKNADKAAA
jgi:hypothetical protein